MGRKLTDLVEEDLALSNSLLDFNEAEFNPGAQLDQSHGALLALDPSPAVPASNVVGSETHLAPPFVVCTELNCISSQSSTTQARQG